MSNAALKLFRGLLLLYPGDFREEYGREMTLVFRDRWREGGRARLVLETLWGLIMELPQEHGRVLVSDVRVAWRGMRKEWGVTVTMWLTLGLVIGVNTAMLGLVDRLLLQPIPGVAAPEQLVRVYGRGYWTAVTRSWPDYLDLLHGTQAFAGVAALQSFPVGKLRIERVTPSYFGLLGVEAYRGRFFAREESSAESAAVLSHAYWLNEFGGSDGALGRVIRVGDQKYTVVGVAAPDFPGVQLQAADVWIPLADLPRERGNHGAVQVVARLRNGVPLAAADRDANAANRRGREADGLPPGEDVMRLGALSMTQGPSAPKEVRVTVWLAVAAGLLFAIGMSNVTQVLVARALCRTKEMGVRLAMGASRGRLMRQTWTETLLLASGGGVVALAFVLAVTPMLHRLLLPEGTAMGRDVDARVMLLAAGLALLAGLVCGVVPAWQARRTDLMEVMKSAGPGRAGRRGWARQGLVVGQIAFSVALLAVAGMFVRSLWRVVSIDTGFDPARISMVTVAGLKDEAAARMLERLARRAAELPGVDAAGVSHTIPFSSAWRTRFYIAGRDAERWDNEGGGRFNRLSTFLDAGAMRALQLKLLRGRMIEETDWQGTARVAVVNEQFAKEVWPGGSAIGQCLQLTKPDAPCTQVVGVVTNTRVENLFEAVPAQYYLPLAQALRGETASGVLVRADREVTRLQPQLQRVLQAMAPGEVVVEVKPLSESLEPMVRSWRLGATAFSAFGLFGLMGATAFRIARLVGVQMLGILTLGLIAGLGLSLVAARWVSSLLYGFDGTDWPSYAGALCAAALAAIIASLSPVRVVGKIDVIAQLNQE